MINAAIDRTVSTPTAKLEVRSARSDKWSPRASLGLLVAGAVLSWGLVGVAISVIF